MADIFHSLRMRASTDDVVRAVTEDELLRPWWANDNNLAVRPVEVRGTIGVAWRCIDGPARVDRDRHHVRVRTRRRRDHRAFRTP